MILGEEHFALMQSEHYNFVFFIFITQFKKNTKHFSFPNHVESGYNKID